MKDTAIDIITQSYPRHAGSKILTLLSECPNRPILSTVIELALSRKMTVSEAEQGHYHPLSIALIAMAMVATIQKKPGKAIRCPELELGTCCWWNCR